jgi:hypothetical protein
MVSGRVTTRRSLHAVAELVLAGSQYRADGEIRLRVTPGGFGTVTGPDVRVDGSAVVLGDRRCEIHGRTPAGLAAALGLTASGLADVYPDGSAVALDDPLAVDAEAAAYLAACFAAGDQALSQLAPDTERILWPEHFDVAITIDDINYGVSPGDADHDEPYAYVGPHSVPAGGFWNEPFGAALTLEEEPDAAAIVEFFRAGRAAARDRGA